MSRRPSQSELQRLSERRKSILPMPGVSLHQIWYLFKGENKQAWFSHVGLAKDGGFKRVGKLFNGTRYFFAFSALVMLGLNLYALSYRNVFVVIWPLEARGLDFPWDWCIEDSRGFLFYYLAFRHIDVIGCGTGRIMRPDVVVAGVELLLVLFLALRAIWLMFRSLSTRDEMNRWHAVAHLFFSVVPDLSNFSALWALRAIMPQVFAPGLAEKVGEAFPSCKPQAATPMGDMGSVTPSRRSLSSLASIAEQNKASFPKAILVLFILGHVLLLLLGFDAFMIKARSFAGAVTMMCSVNPVEDCEGTNDPEQCQRELEYECILEQLGHVVGAIIFVNQVFAITRGGQFVSRLFSSKDGSIGRRAQAMMNTWRALLAQHIWNSEEHNNFRGFWAVMMSFTDSDLYDLVLTLDEELEEEESRPDAALNTIQLSAAEVVPLGPAGIVRMTTV